MDSAHMDRIIWMFRTEPEIRFEETFVISLRESDHGETHPLCLHDSWVIIRKSGHSQRSVLMGSSSSAWGSSSTWRQIVRLRDGLPNPNYQLSTQKTVSGVKYDHQANKTAPRQIDVSEHEPRSTEQIQLSKYRVDVTKASTP